MTEISLNDERIKELMKQAMVEILKERRDLIYDVFAEVIEDLALINAIKEGGPTGSVTKKEVFQILESAS